jgi:hypothetical protein
MNRHAQKVFPDSSPYSDTNLHVKMLELSDSGYYDIHNNKLPPLPVPINYSRINSTLEKIDDMMADMLDRKMKAIVKNKDKSTIKPAPQKRSKNEKPNPAEAAKITKTVHFNTFERYKEISNNNNVAGPKTMLVKPIGLMDSLIVHRKKFSKKELQNFSELGKGCYCQSAIDA